MHIHLWVHSVYIYIYIYIYHYMYMHTIYYTKCAQERDTFLPISLSVLPLLTLAHRNEEWDQVLHEVFEVSPSELSVSTRKQASALRLRPDRQIIIGLSTILEVSVSIRHLPHWPLHPDQIQNDQNLIWVRVHQHLQCLFSCIPLHFNMWSTGTSKKKLHMVKKLILSCNLFQKVKLSYILYSVHVK